MSHSLWVEKYRPTDLSTLTLPNKDLSGVTNDVDIESPLDFHFTELTFPPKLYF